jgi:CDP-glucose 4,6-dehydratase
MENMVDFQKLQSAYKGKKVFLTGHTGFKGAWMLKTLSLLGAEIKGYALKPQTPHDLFYLIEGETLCHSVYADLRDKKILESEIVAFQPDFIFHLAAQPLVRLSYEIPAETFEVNVIGTANVLDVVKLLQKKCSVVLITTDKVYQNNEWEYPYRENDRLGGYDPYSASKACAELLIDSYRNSFFNIKDYENHFKGIAVARAGNVIGGGDWSKDRLIPDIVRSLIAKVPINIRNPNSVRPWQHVLEPILGYLILGSNLSNKPLQFSEAFNFGPSLENTLTVKSLVDKIVKVWGSGNMLVNKYQNNLHESLILKLDISKATSSLGWKPILDIDQTIEFTLKWYMKFLEERDSSNQLVVDQINYFINLKNIKS